MTLPTPIPLDNGMAVEQARALAGRCVCGVVVTDDDPLAWDAHRLTCASVGAYRQDHRDAKEGDT